MMTVVCTKCQGLPEGLADCPRCGGSAFEPPRRTMPLAVVGMGALVGVSEPVAPEPVSIGLPMSPPCHPSARVVASSVRVWCPVCEREFQADDPLLTPIGDLSQTGGAMSTGERRRLLADLAERIRPFGLLGRLGGGSVPVLLVDDPRWPASRRVVTLREDAGEWSYWWETTTRIAPISQVADAARIVVYAMSRTVPGSDEASPDEASAEPTTANIHHIGGSQSQQTTRPGHPSLGRHGWAGWG